MMNHDLEAVKRLAQLLKNDDTNDVKLMRSSSTMAMPKDDANDPRNALGTQSLTETDPTLKQGLMDDTDHDASTEGMESISDGDESPEDKLKKVFGF